MEEFWVEDIWEYLQYYWCFEFRLYPNMISEKKRTSLFPSANSFNSIRTIKQYLMVTLMCQNIEENTWYMGYFGSLGQKHYESPGKCLTELSYLYRAATPFSDSWHYPSNPPSYSGTWNSRPYSPPGTSSGSSYPNSETRTRTASGKSKNVEVLIM